MLLLLGGVSKALPAALPRSREGQFASYRIAAQGMAGAEVIDCEGKITVRFGAAPAAYVIRPDGYVGFRCGASDLATHLPRYLGHLFGSAAVPA